MKIIIDLDEVPCPYAAIMASDVRCLADNKHPMGLLSISSRVRTLDHLPKCDKTTCPKKV